MQLLSSFATFAVSFLVRPIGGMVFGPMGDKIGRRKVLALTMIMMAIGTCAIGLIPSYAAIGFWAPVLLILFRLVQGFSTGGASTFIAEYAPTSDAVSTAASWSWARSPGTSVPRGWSH